MALLLLNFFLHRWVLKPVQALKASTEEIQHGHYDISLPLVGTGEIAALSNSFKKMVEFIRQSNDELERKVEARTEDLHRLTEIDPLTELLNRRGMSDRFDKEVSRYTRQDGSLGLLLLDLDNFKHVNDTHGHSVGDLALCATAKILKSTNRNYDHAGRWGGEEFLLLLPDCTEVDLLSIAERIRLSIQALRIDTGHDTLAFTVSIGAHYSSTPQTMDSMIHQVDKALYAAKGAGRNCVKLAGKLT
jgi:diguanylate cyclase (GGDEF)-like protein